MGEDSLDLLLLSHVNYAKSKTTNTLHKVGGVVSKEDIVWVAFGRGLGVALR